LLVAWMVEKKVELWVEYLADKLVLMKADTMVV
jgi:hypothetical protein